MRAGQVLLAHRVGKGGRTVLYIHDECSARGCRWTTVENRMSLMVCGGAQHRLCSSMHNCCDRGREVDCVRPLPRSCTREGHDVPRDPLTRPATDCGLCSTFSTAGHYSQLFLLRLHSTSSGEARACHLNQSRL